MVLAYAYKFVRKEYEAFTMTREGNRVDFWMEEGPDDERLLIDCYHATKECGVTFNGWGSPRGPAGAPPILVFQTILGVDMSVEGHEDDGHIWFDIGEAKEVCHG